MVVCVAFLRPELAWGIRCGNAQGRQLCLCSHRPCVHSCLCCRRPCVHSFDALLSMSTFYNGSRAFYFNRAVKWFNRFGISLHSNRLERKTEVDIYILLLFF